MDSQDQDQVKPEPILGGPCTQDMDCPEGSVCQISTFSARPFCTVECDYVNDICHTPAQGLEEGKYITGFRCVEMPEGFDGVLNRFCAPECETLSDCLEYGTEFDTCGEPSFTGLPAVGYDAGSYDVCFSPPADPGYPVDPVLCDYKDKVSQPAIIKDICIDYCEYISSCKEKPSDLTEDCCGWGCFLWATPGGSVDLQRKATLQCFILAFKGAYNTAKVCTAPIETCGPPEIHYP